MLSQFSKTRTAHELKLKVALCLLTGGVKHAACSCVAGKTGFRNHVLGLMIMLCKFSMYERIDNRDLEKEEGVNPKKACTSSLQMWHKRGEGGYNNR